MTSTSSPEPRNTSVATVRTWVRAPFGTRSERSAPDPPPRRTTATS